MASIRIEEGTVPYVEDDWDEWEEKLLDKFPDFGRREASLLAEAPLPDFAARQAAADVMVLQTRQQHLASILDKMKQKTQEFSPVILPEPAIRLAHQRRRYTQPRKIGMAASRCFSRVRH